MVSHEAPSRPGLMLLCLDPAHCGAAPDAGICRKRVQIWEERTKIPIAQWSLGVHPSGRCLEKIWWNRVPDRVGTAELHQLPGNVASFSLKSDTVSNKVPGQLT